jgi:DNA processing protein
MAVVVEDERPYWVLLSLCTGIGPIRFQRLLELCGGARAAWLASDLQLAQAGLERRTIDSLKRLRQTTSPTRAATRLAELGSRGLTLLDQEYPANLRQIADPPPVLFIRGKLAAQDDQAVALVGTRRASDYGRAVADRLARDLAAAGITVISGLARGVDTAAHRAALHAGGRTIAVLGHGLDQVYPPENTGLAGEIVDTGRGGLVSELGPGVPPDAVNFPRRNRIIAGLAKATVIVEAGERSGALITADFALEQGREVFVVPGSILSPASSGSNELLKQGATPVTRSEDILEILQPSAQPRPDQAPSTDVPLLDGLGPSERDVWQALSAEPRDVDDLIHGLPFGAGEIAAALAMLEVRGLARQVGPMLYTKI